MLEKLNKLSLPATILIASIVLGGFYFASQISKQNSIEKQQQIELRVQAEADQLKANQASNNELSLQDCLDEADSKYKKSAQYWIDVENQIGSSNVLNQIEKEKAVRQQDKDECYKRYQ